MCSFFLCFTFFIVFVCIASFVFVSSKSGVGSNGLRRLLTFLVSLSRSWPKWIARLLTFLVSSSRSWPKWIARLLTFLVSSYMSILVYIYEDATAQRKTAAVTAAVAHTKQMHNMPTHSFPLK
jgi:hypothetical protein